MAKAFIANSKFARLAFAATLALSLPCAALAEEDIAALDETTIETPLPDVDPGTETPELVVDPGVDTPELVVDPAPVDLANEEPLPEVVPIEWVIRGGEPDVMYMAYGMAGGGMEDVATQAADAAAETALDHINADTSAPKAP
ncbi:MAG: hypothetical protein ACKOAM_08850 [Chakrabartia sp.]